MSLRRIQSVQLFSRPLLTRDASIPIIILHGLLGSSQNWTQLSRIIHQKTSKSVITLDARNHGKSPHSKDMTYCHLAADLKDFCGKHGISEAIFVGHSMGGRAVMTLSLTEPNLVKNLISVDASPIHPTTEIGVSKMRHMLDALKKVNLQKRFSDFRSAKSDIEKQLLHHGINESTMRQWLLMSLTQTGNELRWDFNLDVLSSVFESQLTLVPSDLLSNTFQGQTLFIGGEDSTYIPKDSHEDIKKVFPNSKFCYVPKAGHWVHADNPREFLRTIIQYINTT